MSDKAISYLEKSKGWEIGVGPTVVVVDEGVAKNLSTSSHELTITQEAIAGAPDVRRESIKEAP